MRRILLLVFVSMIVLLPLIAQTEVSIIATKDNTMYSEDGGLSNGAGIYFFAGKTNSSSTRRALIMFDLSGKIPANATITSAKIKLTMSKSNASAVDIKLQKVLASWGEGTSDAVGNNGNEGSGAAATTNDATWSKRFFNTSNWTNQGGDFSATVSTQTSVAGVGSYEFSSTSQVVADVQGWLNDPGSNNGWAIIGGESASATAKRFDSRENATAANRPTLIVTYTGSTSVKTEETIPHAFVLRQNFPNPFNPSTTISFSLMTGGFTRLRIFDMLGNVVATPVNQQLPAGTHAVDFNGKDLSSGVYFYRLQSGSRTAMKKFMLVK